MPPKYSGRQRTRFDEYRALRILQYIFPSQYTYLKLCESPDLQDDLNNVGVEVTSALKSDIQEAVSRAANISGKTEDQLNRNDRQNITKNRVYARKLPNDMYIAGTHAFWGSCFDFKFALHNKIKKLNSNHFSLFEKNQLFIFAWMADDEDICEGAKMILSEISEYKDAIVFDKIFIFREQSLTEIDTQHQMVIYHDFPHDTLHSISEEAKLFITTKEF